MRPNLSLESIAGALAVLGTGVIMAACGGDAPKTPVDAKEVPGATDKAAAPADGHCGADKAHKTGEGTCKGGAAAGHCGAGSEHKAGDAACSAKPGAATDAKPADPTTAAAPAAPTAADAKGTTGTPAPASSTKKPAAGAAPAAAPKKAGASSCGAGTCSAKK